WGGCAIAFGSAMSVGLRGLGAKHISAEAAVLARRPAGGTLSRMQPPTYADVVAAAPVVHRHVRPTPLYEWPALSRLLGCRYYLKHENHTPTTAFKVRGGVYLVSRLPEEQKRRGVIGCTTGNHGQSLAYACRLFGVRCVLVVPRESNPDKVAAMRSLGAPLID